ncbi:GreA/GreB family elongation factor [Mycolicibacterium rutilum]|nr:GreA/GreB family elongation factor [Mycolicibacterium rutilum]
MTSAQRVWMTRRAYIGLQAELARLQVEARPELPDDARAERIRRIEHLLAHAVIDQDPPDDGVAEPGMVLTVRYDDTGATETFLLGIRGAEAADIEVYSPHSPLGAALVGARPGEKRNFTKDGRRLCVSLLAAEPYSSAVL